MNANASDPPPGRAELVPTRASLLARLKDPGSNQSWQEFYDTYHQLIFGWLVHRGLSREDAEDVLMGIVAGVAHGMPEFVYDRKRCKFKTWLFRIVQNRAADHFRRHARGLSSKMVADGMALLDEMADPATEEPDRKWDEQWERNLYHAALDQVRKQANKRYVQIFLYSEIDEHSVAETAADLGTTVEDVSTAKHRIKELLRVEVERLSKKFEDGPNANA